MTTTLHFLHTNEAPVHFTSGANGHEYACSRSLDQVRAQLHRCGFNHAGSDGWRRRSDGLYSAIVYNTQSGEWSALIS
jgi:hypothetical protein